jgi:diaminopimelate decarboxylase
VVGFSRAPQELVCDGVSLSALAGAEGTPVYVYSAAVLRERYRAIDRRLASTRIGFTTR